MSKHILEDAERVFLAIGDRCWGKGKTPNEAVKIATKTGGKGSVHNHRMFLVHPDSTVTGLGDIAFPSGNRPIELYWVVKGKQFPRGTGVSAIAHS